MDINVTNRRGEGWVGVNGGGNPPRFKVTGTNLDMNKVNLNAITLQILASLFQLLQMP